MPESRVLTCVYCGHEYPQGSPSWGHKVLTDHIAQCEKHPMRAVVIERDQLRGALIGLVGASEPDELLAMEAVIKALPVPADESVAMLNAIYALLATPAPEATNDGK